MGSDAFRAWLAPQGIQAVIPARPAPGSPTLRPRGVSGARHAAARDFGWLKGWRRVAAPRYDEYIHRCLGLLYVTGIWNWMNLNIHTA